MFKEKLKQIRLEKGLSQEALAKLLEVPQGTIGRYESGIRIPDANTIAALADVLGCTTDYLLGRE